MTVRPLRIAVIAPIRYPIAQPHAGGLESSVWNQVRTLRSRGHDVLLCATEGSDFLDGGPDEFTIPGLVWDDPSEATDTTYPAGYLDVAFAALDRALAYVREHADRFDIVDNHCLHGLPLGWADRLGVPMVSTLHTPALPSMLEAHAATAEPRSAFLSVGEHTAAEWRREGIESTVVPNGIDTDAWRLGSGGPDLVWTGRIVPEKGTHLALEAAAAAGRRIVLAGRIGDAEYFAEHVEPRLGPDAEYVGVLGQHALQELVGRSACALVTPVWEEPFGLVIAEALATGTPVVSFDTGGIPEVVGASTGAVLVPVGDVRAMATAAVTLADTVAAEPWRRVDIRGDAVDRFSLDQRSARLEAIYAGLVAGHRHRPRSIRPGVRARATA
ncbi:glycosyltransferase [Curtobacterium sp. Leaf261]|uniref:glycosyltransferase n=1 Tax=Curtobacterium sp. Leaf261 TaxID=1736311 RepID=UPI0009EC993F|nr:glycosyltransferase [Curtobacterium sp. Leaf261]